MKLPRSRWLAVSILAPASAFLLGLVGFMSPSALEPQTAVATPTEASITGQKDPVVVPMDHSNGHIRVDVWIGDQGPFLFQLDTYASIRVCLDDDYVERLGLEVVGQTLNSDGQSIQKRDLVDVTGLRLGDQTFGTSRALVDDYDWVGGDEYEVVGLLGFPLFRDKLLTIDYPNSRLVLGSGSIGEDEPHSLLFRTDSGSPDIFLQLGGERVRFGIDTGMSHAMSLLLEDAERLGLSDELTFKGVGRTVYSSFDVYSGTLKEVLDFAGHAVPHLSAEFREGKGRRLIGRDLLKPYAVTFDQKSKRVRFALPSADAHSDH